MMIAEIGNMVNEFKSKFGDGIGGKVQNTSNPNAPTFDPAEVEGKAERYIRAMLADAHIGKLDAFEKRFLMDVYGQYPLTRKQHITLWKIVKKYRESLALGD
jgi:hypothetical protein